MASRQEGGEQIELAHAVADQYNAYAPVVEQPRYNLIHREIETGVEALLTRLIVEGHITEYQAEKFRLTKTRLCDLSLSLSHTHTHIHTSYA